MPTILGLAGAGLTVVFQDFILAFFWVVCADGAPWDACVRLGGDQRDWRRGERDWAVSDDAARDGKLDEPRAPDGAQGYVYQQLCDPGAVFQLFDARQWMWDEMKLSVASGTVAHELLQKMQAAVEAEAKDLTEAEEEWQQAAGNVALGQFGAAPTVDLRPAAAGMDIVVRFMTRATERFERRNRLYETLLKLLREEEEAASKALAAGTAAEAAR